MTLNQEIAAAFKEDISRASYSPMFGNSALERIEGAFFGGRKYSGDPRVPKPDPPMPRLKTMRVFVRV